MSVTKEIHVNDLYRRTQLLLIGKNFANEGFLIFEHAAGGLHCFPSIDAKTAIIPITYMNFVTYIEESPCF